MRLKRFLINLTVTALVAGIAGVVAYFAIATGDIETVNEPHHQGNLLAAIAIGFGAAAVTHLVAEAVLKRVYPDSQ